MEGGDNCPAGNKKFGDSLLEGFSCRISSLLEHIHLLGQNRVLGSVGSNGKELAVSR